MAQAINEEFNPWSGNVSPDGVWQLAGNWFGTGNNQFGLGRETFTSTYPGETSTGFLNLTITPSTNPLQGGEIQTTSGYGYGYYEVRMMPSDVSGGVASFFLIGAPDYREPEFDIEFLLNHNNEVTFTNHGTTGTSGTTYYDLNFDPTADFHTYGINWIPGSTAGTATVQDFVDGVMVHSETSSGFLPPPAGEFIMMNAWSGNANFGGGPPAQNSTTVYDWVHFTPYGGTPPPPPPSAGSVSVNNAATTEGDSGTHVETFTVTRSGGSAAFDIYFATSDSSATTADSDYVAKSGTLHFADGQNTQTVSVTVNGDTKVEANETFNFNLSGATSGATISDAQGVGTITNDDVTTPPPPPPSAGSVSVNNAATTEGDSGTHVETFTVTRSGGSAAFDIYFATSDSSATTADSDYVAKSGTLHFADGQNTQTVSVTVNGDTKVEANETFNFNLSGATSGATISDAQGVGTITNDDVTTPPPPPPSAGSVSVNNAATTEGDSGTHVETFTVTRSGGSAAFDIYFATSDSSATTADSDYVAKSGTLHFADGQNTQTVSVTVNGDTKVEANETFNFNLSGATSGATISDAQGVGTITNDDVTTPPPPPTTITGTSGNDNLIGTSGNDTISGLAGNDRIIGAGGADTLAGGTRHDTFVFKAGEANGDVVLDFHSKGSSSDQLEFDGYGNGSFTQVDATHWAIAYENNSHPAEVIEILGRVALNDYHFLV